MDNTLLLLYIVAALGNGDWAGSCKQKLMEMVSMFNKAIPDLNKYLGTLPSNIKTNSAIIAGFSEAKASLHPAVTVTWSSVVNTVTFI